MLRECCYTIKNENAQLERQLLDKKDSIIIAASIQAHPWVSVALERTGLSRAAVSRRIKRLVEGGYLRAQGSGTRPIYALGMSRFWLMTVSREVLLQSGGEFVVWEQHVAPILRDVSDPVLNLANISFNEMVNNALDHSEAQNVCMGLHLHEGRLQMVVMDDGCGIFRRIAQALHLFDDRLAILELAKGKFTTAASGHSGIGIFVASRMLDGFCIESKGLYFDAHTGYRRLATFDWVNTALFNGQGTLVRMDLALNTLRTAQEIYEHYFNPEAVGGDAFHTTEVPVRLAQLSSHLTSRSQGKWVMERATQFKTVVLDFEDVTFVGQAFVDEIFRVFALAHPQIQINPINMSAEVAQLVRMFAP